MEQSRTVDQATGSVWPLTAVWPAIGAICFGITILYFVGFSNFERAHNAAHDTRHASGFPCH
jgi:cobalt transporter subunit CbtB